MCCACRVRGAETSLCKGRPCSALQRRTPGKILLRYLLRSDEHADLIVKAQINAGFRVPVTWFMADGFEVVAYFGDRTLSRYRSIARKALPAPEVSALSGPPSDPVGEVLREVLEEFERVQLLLRLSPRLRAKHGD